MKYQIHIRDNPKADWTIIRDGRRNETFADAKAYVAEFNKRMRDGKCLQRARVVQAPDDDYREREAKRIAAKIGLLPKDWRDIPPIAGHYARLIKPGVIGFFQNERDAELNRITELSASRYINTFFNHILSDPRSLAEQAGEKVERPQVIFTDNSAEIVKVYLNAGREGSPCASCATKPASAYQSNPRHPAEIYGKPGDVAMAYVLADNANHINDPAAKVVARCILYPAKKLYVGLYGYPHDKGTLTKWLNDNHYTYGYEWVGCRLNYVTNGKNVVTAQCDFGGVSHITKVNGETVVRVVRKGGNAKKPNELYNYSTTGIAYGADNHDLVIIDWPTE